LATAGSAAVKRYEVTDAAAVIVRLTGSAPRYLRFPGGCHDAADLALVASLGEQPLGWDVISGDAFQPDARVVVANVLREVRAGSIIVMRLGGTPNAPATASALGVLLPRLQAAGYQFVTLEQLLGP
jgi:peptidoglycan/xylan/chitin deacetylase (PgdA/CDA1 family)